ncbi:hypothetical protein JCM8097_003569 [Rhodosporidiobolus ruineniae]
MPLKLYDLVSDVPRSPFFSPACVRTRLSLLTKGITDFETVEVRYSELREVWKPRFGVEKATAPFIELEDGTFLMDSVEIALWLDKTYPNRQNLFLPEAPLPVHVESAKYKAAVEDYHTHERAVSQRPHAAQWVAVGSTPAPGSAKGELSLAQLVFMLFARRMVRNFDEETAEYWTSVGRMGEGAWEYLSSQSDEKDVETVELLRTKLAQLSPTELPEGSNFISSPSKPGLKDFSVCGIYRLLHSVSASLAAETFGHPEAGAWAAWLVRMEGLYGDGEEGLRKYWERDAKE